MKESINAKRLRLWKARQEAEGYDVSNVNTLAEAERYFDNPIKKGVEVIAPEAPTNTEAKPLEELSNKELVELGNTLGLKLTVFTKKVELIAAIEAAQNAGPEGTEPTEGTESTEGTEGTEGAETPEAPEAPEGGQKEGTEPTEPTEAPVVPQVTFTDDDIKEGTETPEAPASTEGTEVNENVEGNEEENTPSIEEIEIISAPPVEEAQNVAQEVTE